MAEDPKGERSGQGCSEEGGVRRYTNARDALRADDNIRAEEARHGQAMTCGPIKITRGTGGKVIESFRDRKLAVRAFWTLTAHELKNGRKADLVFVDPTLPQLVVDDPPSDLPEWVLEVLRPNLAGEAS